MKLRRTYSVLMTACVIATASAAFGFSASTPPSYVNAVGQPVSATADFAIKPGSVTVSVQNLTDGPRYFTQSLSGLSFKVKNYRGDPYLQTSRGNVRLIAGDGTPGQPAVEITNWIFDFKDGVFTLTAPGKSYTILPETSPSDYFNADSSLLNNGQRPYITGPVSFLIIVPGMPTDMQVEQVEFRFSDTGGDIGSLNGDVARPNGTPEFGGDGYGGTPALTGGTTSAGSTWTVPQLPPQTINPGYSNAPAGGAPSSSGSSDSGTTPRTNPPSIIVPTPEVATLGMLGLGSLLLMRRKSR